MLDINDFKENLVEFECVRVRDAKTVWVNDAEAADLESVLDASMSEASFAHYFAYVSKANRCFAEAELEEPDNRIYLAERYGGRGVGTNGGGGRTGNFGNFQVKGAGPNLLARSDSVWHSYGSLNIMDGAYEAIYSTVLGRILPLGCAKVYGLIRTSNTGAFQLFNWGTVQAELSPVCGALLVRERVVRPAHFMYAELFSPPKTTSMKRESIRIQSVYRQLKSKFDNDNHFIQFVGKFILSSAKQFAFARAARIAHGGVTPSNICLDGRWIDLTEARFLSGGKNWRGLSPFFDEPQVVIEAVRQMLYIYGKCNGAQFNAEPLLRYYGRVFENCFAYYSLMILGIPEKNLDKIAESEDGKAYAAAYATVLLKSKTPVPDVPAEHDPSDPVIAFMRLSYLCVANDNAALLKLSELLRCLPTDAQTVVAAFRNVLRAAALPQNESFDPSTFRNCCIAFAIKALRWAYLSAYFYRGRITQQLYSLVNDRGLPDLGSYIQDCVDQAKWIFDIGSPDRIVIAETGEVRISYNQSRHLYNLCTLAGKCKWTFERYEDCLAFATANYPDLRVNGTFDLVFYLRGLMEVLVGIENMLSVPA